MAHLCGIGGEYATGIHNNPDPTNKVLELWINKDFENSTIDKLLSYLEELDRFDIVDDITHLIGNGALASDVTWSQNGYHMTSLLSPLFYFVF